MSDLSARLDLPLIQPSQAQKHVTHNEALQVLDGLVQAALEETGAETPPFEPVNGQLYALGADPVDDWADQAGKLALRAAGAWLFINPQEGWRAWDKAAGQFKVYDGAAWVQILPDLNNLDGVGVNTTYDATNLLAVAAAASLFTHDGAGHQLKVNKAAAVDTASLLFQSGFTGHAEMGLAGDTAFSVKVSDDGETWYDALKADAAAQEVEIDFRVVGNAVQQSATDTTAGRLMRADYGYSPGNLIGTVSGSGGTPTGAVIERGSNSNGDYVRFADGTQICTASVDFDWGLDDERQTFPFPADFHDVGTAVTYGSVRGSGADADWERFEGVIIFAQAGAQEWAAVQRTAGLSNSSLSLFLCAIGRWF